jgi:hypothetical protein
MQRFITNKSGLDAVPLLLVLVVDFQKVIVYQTLSPCQTKFSSFLVLQLNRDGVIMKGFCRAE